MWILWSSLSPLSYASLCCHNLLSRNIIFVCTAEFKHTMISCALHFTQGLYSVWNTWKRMEINFLFFKVMNSMKFGVAVCKSMDFWIFLGGAQLLFASVFFMQFDQNLSWILLKLTEIFRLVSYTSIVPGCNTGYIFVSSFFNPV